MKKTESNIVAFCSVGWCGESIMIKPIVEELESEHPSLIFVELDVDSENIWSEDNSKYLSIKETPTLLFVKNGDFVDRMKNFNPKKLIKEWILKNEENS